MVERGATVLNRAPEGVGAPGKVVLGVRKWLTDTHPATNPGRQNLRACDNSRGADAGLGRVLIEVGFISFLPLFRRVM